MHELSIVMNIVDAARRQVVQHHADHVERIELEVGTLAGIEFLAFEFAWKAAVPDTVLARAERVVHHISARARCADCALEYELAQLYEPCPYCGGCFSDLLRGKELKIRKMVLVGA